MEKEFEFRRRDADATLDYTPNRLMEGAIRGQAIAVG